MTDIEIIKYLEVLDNARKKEDKINEIAAFTIGELKKLKKTLGEIHRKFDKMKDDAREEWLATRHQARMDCNYNSLNNPFTEEWQLRQKVGKEEYKGE